MRYVWLLSVVVVLASCGGADDAATPVPTTAARVAPAVSGTTLDGQPLSLASLRGKPVVVNVWSSW
jgi:cytochrome oxidase Cu insertion factor (SCO1/SenC/PrrC family)